MARKERTNARNQITNNKRAILQNKTDREKKIMNAIANTSIILMSTIMGAFSQVMTKMTTVMASGMAEAIGGKGAEEQVNKEINQKLPELDEKMKTLVSDVRKDVYAQLNQQRKEIELLLSDPAYDIGPQMVDKYDFKLPKLTEELDDRALARYIQLLESEDPSFAEMFKALTEWINTLPKIPEKMSQE